MHVHHHPARRETEASKPSSKPSTSRTFNALTMRSKNAVEIIVDIDRVTVSLKKQKTWLKTVRSVLSCMFFRSHVARHQSLQTRSVAHREPTRSPLFSMMLAVGLETSFSHHRWSMSSRVRVRQVCHCASPHLLKLCSGCHSDHQLQASNTCDFVIGCSIQRLF